MKEDAGKIGLWDKEVKGGGRTLPDENIENHRPSPAILIYFARSFVWCPTGQKAKVLHSGRRPNLTSLVKNERRKRRTEGQEKREGKRQGITGSEG